MGARRVGLVALLALGACDDGDGEGDAGGTPAPLVDSASDTLPEDETGAPAAPRDLDGDGLLALADGGTDCDDADPRVGDGPSIARLWPALGAVDVGTASPLTVAFDGDARGSATWALQGPDGALVPLGAHRWLGDGTRLVIETDQLAADSRYTLAVDGSCDPPADVRFLTAQVGGTAAAEVVGQAFVREPSTASLVWPPGLDGPGETRRVLRQVLAGPLATYDVYQLAERADDVYELRLGRSDGAGAQDPCEETLVWPDPVQVAGGWVTLSMEDVTYFRDRVPLGYRHVDLALQVADDGTGLVGLRERVDVDARSLQALMEHLGIVTPDTSLCGVLSTLAGGLDVCGPCPEDGVDACFEVLHHDGRAPALGGPLVSRSAWDIDRDPACP